MALLLFPQVGKAVMNPSHAVVHPPVLYPPIKIQP